MSSQLLRSITAFPLPWSGHPSPSQSMYLRLDKKIAPLPHLVWIPSPNPPSALPTCTLSPPFMMSRPTPLSSPPSGLWVVRLPLWEMRWSNKAPWPATPCLCCSGCARCTDSAHRSMKSVTITPAPTAFSASAMKSWSHAFLFPWMGLSRSFQAPAFRPRRRRFIEPSQSWWSKPSVRSQVYDLSKLWAVNVM